MLDPHQKLSQVHPDLVKIMQAAKQEPQPFQIVYGIRTIEAQAEALAKGNSTTMHSRHLPNVKGLACAVDVAAMIDGKLSFAPGHEAHVFGLIALEVKAAAELLSIPLEWGGDWKSFKDWGHFQLPWSYA